MEKRAYDMIIWGATGFTGKLVAEYLREVSEQEEIRWMIAGRNRTKLESLAGNLGLNPREVIIADSFDLSSLKKMCQQTCVILTTVGPYAIYGSDLVEACIAEGTDYCDLSGEVHWMRKMIDQWQDKAVAAGVRLVNCCGFDSVPSDMGVLFMQNNSRQETGQYFKTLSMRLKNAKGGFSGGTFASMFNIREEAEKDRSIYKVIMRRYSLNPDPEFDGPDARDLRSVVYDPIAASWIAPFVMATINTRIVRRAHALANFPYGLDFTYDEAIYCGKGIKGRLKAWVYILPLGVVRAARPGSLLNKVMRWYLPDPGQGPSAEKREKGWFKLAFYGENIDGRIAEGEMIGQGDPGYSATAKMITECAICLTMDEPKVPKRSGFLTPATAFGELLINRLTSRADMTFRWKGFRDVSD